MTDLHIGGDIMWVLGDTLMLWPMIPVALRWMHMDERKADRIDRELTQQRTCSRDGPPARRVPVRRLVIHRLASHVRPCAEHPSGLLSACGGPGDPPAPLAVAGHRPGPRHSRRHPADHVGRDGRPRSPHYRGKDIVMATFLTLCQDECPSSRARSSPSNVTCAQPASGTRCRLHGDHRRSRSRHAGPPGGLFQGVRCRLGDADRDAGQPRRPVEVLRCLRADRPRRATAQARLVDRHSR